MALTEALLGERRACWGGGGGGSMFGEAGMLGGGREACWGRGACPKSKFQTLHVFFRTPEDFSGPKASFEI